MTKRWLVTFTRKTQPMAGSPCFAFPFVLSSIRWQTFTICSSRVGAGLHPVSCLPNNRAPRAPGSDQATSPALRREPSTLRARRFRPADHPDRLPAWMELDGHAWRLLPGPAMLVEKPLGKASHRWTRAYGSTAPFEPAPGRRLGRCPRRPPDLGGSASPKPTP